MRVGTWDYNRNVKRQRGTHGSYSWVPYVKLLGGTPRVFKGDFTSSHFKWREDFFTVLKNVMAKNTRRLLHKAYQYHQNVYQ